MGTHKPPEAESLHGSLRAWNRQAHQSAVPLLTHCHSSMRALRNLVSQSRHYHTLEAEDGTPLEGIPDGSDSAQTLRQLTAQLHDIERLLTNAAKILNEAELAGERLAQDFATVASRLNQHVDIRSKSPDVTADAGGEFAADYQLLLQLVEAQKTEIESLHRARSSQNKHRRKRRTENPPTAVETIEIHSVNDFLQDSPIANYVLNPTYHQRLLEAANSPDGQRVPMGELLTMAGLISERQLTNALDHQQNGYRRPLGALLVDLGYTSEEAIAQALAAQLSLPFIVLAREFVQEDAVSKVPVHLAKRHGCLPLNFNGHALTVAMANPLDLIALEDLHIASGTRIKPCVASRGEINSHIALHYNQ